MPELPEVETIVRKLKKEIFNKRIVRFQSDTPRLFRLSAQADDRKNFKEIERKVLGKSVEDVERIGKNIIFKLSSGDCLVLHLMMTGKILLNPKENQIHDRLRMKLSGSTNLVFNDIRKFGRCRILSDLKNLGGQDALAISLKDFGKIFEKRKTPIKNILLDQKRINGIGNIYSDEILWHAGVYPLRGAGTLTEKEIKNIFLAMKKVLNLAIKKQGSTMRDYRKPDGTSGGYYPIRKVYRRTGEKCSRDGEIIKRLRVGGRSTHFCPGHQI